MTRRPRRSAPLLVGGLLCGIVLGPLLLLLGTVIAASTVTASFYGLADGPGSGPLLVLGLGLLLTVAGWAAALLGLHRLLTTIDAVGARFLSAPDASPDAVRDNGTSTRFGTTATKGRPE